ncbi:MAG: FkbM family methyltransferase [Gammaproteobacteria bacterium]|nr:FkbM family methyltransferase [Gammaproteobacteria bacterium]
MPPNITLKLVDGVHIVVPDSLDLITTYVLREQGDWFEDEIKFLRHLIQPGQRVIDIGANYGVYTLAMAKLVGPTGSVWAFEPASNTADLLATSIATNNFSHVMLVRSALSNTTGTAQLSLNENSELNELVRGEQFMGASETVPLVTLDASMDSYGWKGIDFMKIDAEGEETNILRGGRNFLTSESPLIQYEIKAGDEFHLDLVRQFSALGYQSYRLVPGLNLLIPFDDEVAADGYLLNLFCCKPDRAAHLATQGFLVKAAANISSLNKFDVSHISNKSVGYDKYGWQETLVKLPYGKVLSETWVKMMANSQSNEVEESLFLYSLSRDTSLPIAERFAALEASYLKLKHLCETQPVYLRLSSLARVARDYGARSVAVNALGQLCNTIFQQRQVNPVEPFLAPGERFDSVSPHNQNSIGNWIAAAALEELERNQTFSSYYSGMSSMQRLELIHNIGLGGDEMQRRLILTRQRFGAVK